MLREVPFFRHQQGPSKRLARQELAPHKPPPRLYQRKELRRRPRKSLKQQGTRSSLTPRARLGRGAAYTLTPLSPKNSVEGLGTAGVGTPLTTSSRTECRAASKLIPPTANSGAGLGTEGAYPPPTLTPRAKPGRRDTLRLAPLLSAATTKGSKLGGDPGPLKPSTNLGGGRTLTPPSTNPENAEPEAGGNKTADNWPTEAFIAARSDYSWPNGPQKPAPAGENTSHWNLQILSPLLLFTEHFSTSFTNAWNWRRER
ncbi:hypothetical protein E2C01_061155 [Portunus trituberculatus]|uniref:Uncharacterized protein n=1 Tax=Portunus trituberculatus TaxID=210409 RepID=A0A5B7HEA5_PORTR|nr:hypothetical protein [Portunus trituberculatus]